jgi:hypothetical protein
MDSTATITPFRSRPGGLNRGQTDLGWVFIRILTWLGLARDLKLPENTVHRSGLRRVRRDEGNVGAAAPAVAESIARVVPP